MRGSRVTKQRACSGANRLSARLIVCIAGLFAAVRAVGDDQVTCGTELRPADVQRYLALRASGAFDPPTTVGPIGTVVVPIALHIIRFSDGSGGPSDIENRFNSAVADATSAFVPIGIEFCRAGPIDIIDDDTLATGGGNIRTVNVVPNAINMWLRPIGGVCASSGTLDALQGIAGPFACLSSTSGNETFAHELGHYFDLHHPHSTLGGPECVDGSNCDIAGDLLCDTPADPNLILNGGLVGPPPDCLYTGNVPDPCGSALPYDPDTTNIMSYTRGECRDHFTPQQIALARATLLNLRPEFLADNDCDGNGRPDVCDIGPASVQFESPSLAPVFFSAPNTPAYTLFAPPQAASDVVLTFTARADLGDPNEAIDVDLNGIAIGSIFGPMGSQCSVNGDVESLTVSTSLFNSVLSMPGSGGNVTITMAPNINVGPECTDAGNFLNGFITVAVDYTPAGFDVDTNGNGILDACDQDCDTNGVLDFNEVAAGTANDCNANFSPDSCDINGGGQVLVAADFENGLDPGWSATGSFHVTDQCGQTIFFDNTTMFAYAGDSATCRMVPNEVSQLILPPIAIPPGATALHFRENLDSNNAGDQASVLVNGVVVDLQFFDAGVGWRRRTLDLGPFAGRTVTIVFQWRTAANMNDLGWQIDDIRVVAGSVDCNGNLMPDDCETVGPFSAASGMLSPFGDTSPQTFTVPSAPVAFGDVVINLESVADLGAPFSRVTVALNGGTVANLFFGDPTPPCPALPLAGQFIIRREEYNFLLQQSPTGDAAFLIRTVGGVDPAACSPSFVSMTLDYLGSSPADLDADGVLDVCAAGTPIPALSDWGILAMGLLLMATAGWIIVVRRRTAV